MPLLGSLLGASPLVRDGVTVLSGVVRRKDPGHQGVHLSNLLSLDRGRQLDHREDHVWFEDRWMVASLCDE
jgi:hypothetical protein